MGFVRDQQRGAWWCPSDLDTGNTAGGQRVQISYGHNEQLSQVNNFTSPVRWTIASIDQVPSASITAHIVDGARSWNPGNGTAGGAWGTLDGVPASGSTGDAPDKSTNHYMRHTNTSTNTLFVDGHATNLDDLRQAKLDGEVVTYLNPNGPLWAWNRVRTLNPTDTRGNVTDQ
jgi:prepilin-type processing-associated H-X9-DG protein